MKKEFGFVLAAAILLAGCGQKKETTTTTARPVKTTIVESRSIIRKDFSGIVEAVEYVKLAFRVNGQIIQLPVIEGQKVKKGESFFIPAGLVHAIGKGCLIAEIQQTSDITYRIYDYNRKDAKRLRHKWNVTNGSSPGKRSPYRNMKSASPTSRRRSLNTNYLPTICATPS